MESLSSATPATVTITTTNTPPVANAGPNQALMVGATVTLDGSQSFDADNDPITYSWSFLNIPEIEHRHSYRSQRQKIRPSSPMRPARMSSN